MATVEDHDLFRARGAAEQASSAPLAARMRPRTLDEFVGQDHIVGPGRLLRRAIQADQLSSLIFYGPPGTGKTTLAQVIAGTTRARFTALNAVLAGVKQLREAIAAAREARDLHGQRTILFIDEVHRWNKAQQDALLPSGRERHHRADRRHHREPLLRGDQAAGQPQPHLPAPGPGARGVWRGWRGWRWPTPSAGWAAIAPK